MKRLRRNPEKFDVLEIPLSQLVVSRKSLFDAMNDFEYKRPSRTKGPLDVWWTENQEYALVDGYHRLFEALLGGATKAKIRIVGLGYSDYWAIPALTDRFRYEESLPYRGLEDLADTEILDDYARQLRTNPQSHIAKLYHGTCRDDADKLLKKGFAPHGSKAGANQGNPAYLYVSTLPEDALWFAEEKGCDVVLVVKNVPLTSLDVDPEDGTGETLEQELEFAQRTGLPAKLVVTKSLSADHFQIYLAQE